MAEKKLKDLPPSYTNVGFDSEPVAGPSAPMFHEAILSEDFRDPALTPTAPLPEEIPGANLLAYNPPSLVFEEIYEACAQYVKSHCCYGSRFINQMKLTDINNKGVFHYTLESFGEKRESATHYTPYKGGPIDGPENGRPPDPWDMTVLPSDMFKDCSTRREIPHTDHVSTCRNCNGRGKETCGSCCGSGYDSCSSCTGSGRDSENNTCSSCSGSGRTTCWRCGGSGEETCGKCDGYGKIKDCRILIVTWTNHLTDYISDAGNLPDDLVRKAKGIEMLKQKDRALLPITNAPEESVNAASARLLNLHQTAFPNELIIRQRHMMRAIPCTRVTYKWKEREGEFYVYGTDRQVYFEDYPQPCCCCTCC